jgi:microcompartment protein CcmK/EutM
MILARVIDTVVSTVKHPRIETMAVFVVQPIDPQGGDAGATFLAIDHAQAGPGDVVLVLREGSGIRQILDDPHSPIRCLIVGVVDEIKTEAA